jgi:hypothetical protein
MPGPVVDTLSAQEFSREISDLITADELRSVAAGLERKSRVMRDMLLSGTLDRSAIREVLGLIFATRRRADEVLDQAGPERLAAAITDLLDHRQDLADRFDRFDEVLGGLPSACADLPGELLHFTYPDRYWLWTRWIWDPGPRTGALALVTTEDAEFSLAGLAEGAGRGEIYLTIGRATAFVNETGKAAGFTDAAPGLFGTDIFLAAVYAVYLYTVLRMRMTREFNQLIPRLPDLTRRLLGVYYQPASDHEETSDAHRRT